MNSRTIRAFSVPADIWPIVDVWAAAESFRLIDDNGIKRSYQKGFGLMILPTKFEIGQADGSVHFEAWIHASMINRIFTLFMMPEEMTIESGGFRAIIPRTISRDQINRLMIQLGQPMIA